MGIESQWIWTRIRQRESPKSAAPDFGGLEDEIGELGGEISVFVNVFFLGGSPKSSTPTALHKKTQVLRVFWLKTKLDSIESA